MDPLYSRFCNEVCGHIPRATSRERGDIARELTHHLEDHARQLADRGVEEGAAADRAVQAMGDPSEIGAKWNAQLSPFWLWMGRVLCVAGMCLSFVIFVGLYGERFEPILNSLLARVGVTGPLRDPPYSYRSVGEMELDLRCPYGDSVIYLYGLTVLQNIHDPDERAVRIGAVAYHRDPFRDSVLLTNITWDGGAWLSYWASPARGASAGAITIPLPPGSLPESVVLTGSSFGNSFRAVIPLDWEAIS